LTDASGIVVPDWNYNLIFRFYDVATGGTALYKGTVASILELVNLYANGVVPPQCMLTTSIHIMPGTVTSSHGLQAIEDTVLIPLSTLQSEGKVILTDFTIRFSLSKTSWVKMKLYDILGQEMATLLDAKMGEGTHSLVFDAKELPSGVYLLQLITGGEQKNRKMLILR